MLAFAEFQMFGTDAAGAETVGDGPIDPERRPDVAAICGCLVGFLEPVD